MSRTTAMSRMSGLIAAACIAALALGACGSSYKGLTKAEFVKQAEAICKKSDTKLTKVGASLTSDSTVKDLQKAYAQQIVPLVNDEVSQIRHLKPPKADRKTVSKMLDDLTTGLDQAAAKIKSLKSKADLASVAAPPALKTANAEAKAYGLSTCADTSS